jgi:hypothetical protein
VKALLDTDETLSLYLNVNNAVRENQADTPAWRIELKNALQRLEADLGESRRGAWKAIRERVDRYFNDYRPQSKGLVLFVTPDDEQVYELPVEVENAAAFGKPMVAPMIWQMDEYEPYLVVMVDQEEARFYQSYLGQTDFEEGMEIDLDEYDFGQKTLMPATSAVMGGHPLTQGSHRDEFDDTLKEHRARFYRDVVETTAKLADRESIQRIILAGSEQSAHAVHNEMDDTLRKQVVTIKSIPMRSSPTEIFSQIQQESLNNERDREMELINEVVDFAKSGGRGALGQAAVEKAMTMQQIELLVMSWPPENMDMNTVNGILRRLVALNSRVELVHGAAAMKLNEEGQGIGARLYFAV